MAVWWRRVLILLAVLVMVVAVWITVALPTGHVRVRECLRADGQCVGLEDFRHPQRIALLVGGGVLAGVLLWIATRRRSSGQPQNA
jgi:hypothetical protein